MIRYCLFFFLLMQMIFIDSIRSQGISNIWILGYDTVQNQNTGKTVIDFSGGVANTTLSYEYSRNFLRTSALIADSSGDLLFYTNGFDVCNKFGEIMPNGANIDSSQFLSSWYNDGMPYQQMSLILPSPGNDSLYFLFHETIHSHFIDTMGAYVVYPNSLYYSIINMKSDSGRGDLILREQVVFNDTLTSGKLTAVKHANGRDWWILLYRYEGDGYIKLLVTPQGIGAPVYQNIGPRFRYLDAAQSVFSPVGNRYAIADSKNGVLIMDFDRCTGTLSNPIQISINDSALTRGVAFSENGRYLYVSGVKYLYQFDSWAGNIATTQNTVAVWDGYYSPQPPFATTFNTMQLASNGKIYINSTNSVKVLHSINYPDSAGISCGVCQHCLSLPTYNAFTMPNIPNYFLGADSGSVCDTLQLAIKKTEPKTQVEGVSVFPNPVQNYLQINCTPNENLKALQVFDVNGEIVLERKPQEYSHLTNIDVSKFVNGIYLCKLIYQNKIVSCKFVKE